MENKSGMTTGAMPPEAKFGSIEFWKVRCAKLEEKVKVLEAGIAAKTPGRPVPCFRAVFDVMVDEGDYDKVEKHTFLIYAESEAKAREMAREKARSWFDIPLSSLRPTTEQEFVGELLKKWSFGERTPSLPLPDEEETLLPLSLRDSTTGDSVNVQLIIEPFWIWLEAPVEECGENGNSVIGIEFHEGKLRCVNHGFDSVVHEWPVLKSSAQ